MQKLNRTLLISSFNLPEKILTIFIDESNFNANRHLRL
ncbi:hypothetical protein BuS5_02050 [Desulfosarcina sp. BuS5]|nr:hypothetical protein BuS5_02050 [Desulfosarcina sp. BuS5]